MVLDSWCKGASPAGCLLLRASETRLRQKSSSGWHPRQYTTIESWVRPPLLLVINSTISRYHSSMRCTPRVTIKYPSEQAINPSAHVQIQPLVIDDPEAARIPPLFDNEISLPVEDVLPDLLEFFFHYYANSFCFLNRSYLNILLSRGECSKLLIYSRAALSFRSGNPSKFVKYFRSKQDGSLRQGWDLPLHF